MGGKERPWGGRTLTQRCLLVASFGGDGHVLELGCPMWRAQPCVALRP